MNIKDGIVQGMSYTSARHIGARMSPSIVVLHDTASTLDKGSAAGYLRDNNAKVSVHFVVELDGSVVQQVPVNRVANHAGRSAYHGRKGCNQFSIGIELVNPGRMTEINRETALTWYGKTLDRDAYQIIEAQTPEHGHGLWMAYPEPQIAALLVLLEFLFAEVETLEDITTHWYISPGRKVDTNPLFPLDHIRSVVLGRDDPALVELDAVPPNRGYELIEVNAPGDGFLNLRRWPSFNPNILAQIPHDTVLPLVKSGTFGGRKWLCVEYGQYEGWIVATYADHLIFKETVE
ncbi:N-acetylmuramoyl-L-alanine amidase [Phaeobacter inhibens]|uniref:N-acetylmuramoyl-L-alanine amidase n=1 Tax=Phaeobacter inhibens TaxID=221822 RepID=UPI00076BB0FC|nr:N-acetylmuramoyl-L-alanine amidase [Phaeobacter inhibens]KXF92105.1 N-acetylmuramoyl-L-alanine amidase [Phaeobacter inhibens]WHP69940.1 N-acetylmuramoyl-L-alanine amidase [Phaeobacter inhibens]